MLEADSDLAGITLEGLRVSDEAGVEGSRWLGVDCGLYYRGDNGAWLDAQQLKYSGADPKRSWTVARVSAAKGGGSTGSGSVIRRLADVYRGWVIEKKNAPQSFTVSLVTNQPISTDLQRAISLAKKGVPAEYSKRLGKNAPPLHRLVKASGLTPTQFGSFAARLELVGGTASRFLLEDQILQAVIAWTEADSFEVAERLRRFARDRMLPESSREMITVDRILAQFAAIDRQTLFPCAADVRRIESAVPRETIRKVTDELVDGHQRVCLHGSGGVGKTTALQQLAKGLPAESIVILFDCYGGGSYLDPEKLRHRPSDAFLQLINETAARLRLPLLTPAGHFPDPVRSFHRRLKAAAETFAAARPGALLVLVVDAADNSVSAASGRIPSEVSFVHDFAAIGEIPANVRFVITARTSRVSSLKLPSTFLHRALGAFTPEETKANVARVFAAEPHWIEDFHSLSQGIPRVQAYAFGSATDDPKSAIDALRPAGKNLDAIFQAQFDFALKKGGGSDTDVRTLCAALIALPRPVPVDALGRVTGVPQDRLVDIVQDLAPGLRHEAGFVAFADEDFEHFIREAGAPVLAEVRVRAAEWMMTAANQDPYAGLHVATALLAAEKRIELLAFVEGQPEPPASLFPDPVRRSEAHVRRLQVATKACREAGDPARAMRFVLQGAEAARRDASVRTMLADNPELAARFARDTAGRLVLGDPDAQKKWGALILQMMAADARTGDFVAVREGGRRFDAWQVARQDAYRADEARWGRAQGWEISEADFEAYGYVIAVEKGGAAAIRWLLKNKSLQPAWGAGLDLVDRLLAEGRRVEVADMAAAAPTPFVPFILGPLACAGEPIDVRALLAGLQALRRTRLLDFARFAEGHAYADTGALRFFESYLVGCELLASHPEARGSLAGLLEPFLRPEFRWAHKRHLFEVPTLDLIVRAAALNAADMGAALEAKSLFPIEAPEKDENGEAKVRRGQRGGEEKLHAFVGPLIQFYEPRAAALISPSAHPDLRAHLHGSRKAFDPSWRYEAPHQASQVWGRLAVAMCVFTGLAYSPSAILDLATELRGGWSRDHDGALQVVVRRLSAHTSVHGELLAGLTAVASALRNARVGAEARMDDLVSYARLLAAFSPHDAQVIFQSAVVVADELDAEVYDQCRLIDALSQRAADRAPPVARDLAEVAYDAGVRLADHRSWGWGPAMQALARLDLGFALACVSRWDDAKIAPRDDTLDSVLAIGLEAGRIPPPTAVALIVLQGYAGEATLASLNRAAGETWPALSDALAHHVLRGSVTLECKSFVAMAPSDAEPGSPTAVLLARETMLADLEPPPPLVRSAPDPRHGPPRPPPPPPTPFDLAEIMDSQRLAAAIDARFETARQTGQHPDFNQLVALACEAVPIPRRIDFLEALRGLPLDPMLDQRMDAIMATIHGWSDSLAVVAWSDRNAAALVREHFGHVTRYVGYDRTAHRSALALCKESDAEMLVLLLEGIEIHGEAKGAAWTLGIAVEAAARMTPEDAAGLLLWYVSRLRDRLPEAAIEGAPVEVLTPTKAVARTFYAAMSDVDQRIRWRAAHALRQLAALGGSADL
ncbi:hypothetical protein, partial [uncultured Phenylobacterium sp.]|uniref:hypothetical protein n=1 Tax=uncultured Phenylobacterium sp. TaxID=349273 RepID=UPI0025FAD009